MGGTVGNTNAAKGKQWKAAINRALEKRSRVDAKEALDALAEKLLVAAESGEPWALKELGDRIDGRPAQAIVGGDEDDNPIAIQGVVKLVRPD